MRTIWTAEKKQAALAQVGGQHRALGGDVVALARVGPDVV